jgi:hypothetical protein
LAVKIYSILLFIGVLKANADTLGLPAVRLEFSAFSG